MPSLAECPEEDEQSSNSGSIPFKTQETESIPAAKSESQSSGLAGATKTSWAGLEFTTTVASSSEGDISHPADQSPQASTAPKGLSDEENED